MPALRGHLLFQLDFGSRSLCIYLLGLWASPSALSSPHQPSRPDFPAALNSAPVYFCSPYLLTYKYKSRRSLLPLLFARMGSSSGSTIRFRFFFPTSYQALSACQTLGLGLSPCPILPLWSDYLESFSSEVYLAPVHGDT